MKLSSLIVACVFSFATPLATASYVNGGKVEYLLVTPAGNVFFRAGAQVGPPACSTTNEYAFQVVGPNAAGGKAMLASLIAAQAQNKWIFISGLGTCEIGVNRETVGYIAVYTN